MATTRAGHSLVGYKGEVEAGDRWVVMTNALARAGHGLTLAEKRLVMLGVSKLDSRKFAPDAGYKTKITAAEFAECAEIEMNVAYRELKAAGNNLYERSIRFFVPDKRRKGKPLSKEAGTINHMRWVSRVTYHKNEGWIELAWNIELLPHLTGLRKSFTKYKLSQGVALRSQYSWKLLELLTAFQERGGKGWAEYTIEDFCTSMEATEKQRENFAKIRTKIIEPAVKELTEKDGWLIEWQPIKRGRKVEKVKFTFKRDPQGKLF